MNRNTPAMPTISAVTPLSMLSRDRKSTRLNSSHVSISYAVFCLKKKKIPAVNLAYHRSHTNVLIAKLRDALQRILLPLFASPHAAQYPCSRQPLALSLHSALVAL